MQHFSLNIALGRCKWIGNTLESSYRVPKMNMAISRTFWTKFLSVIFIAVLLLEAIETRPPKKAKTRPRVKHCGKKNHLCEPGSRKLCCTVGYTCRVTESSSNQTRQEKKKRNFGTCQPILPPRVSEKEIEEKRPIPSSTGFKSSWFVKMVIFFMEIPMGTLTRLADFRKNRRCENKTAL